MQSTTNLPVYPIDTDTYKRHSIKQNFASNIYLTQNQLNGVSCEHIPHQIVQNPTVTAAVIACTDQEYDLWYKGMHLLRTGSGEHHDQPEHRHHTQQSLHFHQLQQQKQHSHHDVESDEDEIALYPLNNQVGGHTRLLLLNQSTVIKPLNLRELEFYQNIPSDIQQFVPKYRGVMQATTMGGSKLEKRYSPSFRDDPVRKTAASKRKREEVLRLVERDKDG
uniref:Kinase n=1 Tax=Anopheles maculatus TaxID=74869 RepID=A0A182SNL7_9DIPT